MEDILNVIEVTSLTTEKNKKAGKTNIIYCNDKIRSFRSQWLWGEKYAKCSIKIRIVKKHISFEFFLGFGSVETGFYKYDGWLCSFKNDRIIENTNLHAK